ncbi:MAG: hypothetical protein ACRD7E_30710 [Bryobacteraceae bacterium]
MGGFAPAVLPFFPIDILLLIMEVDLFPISAQAARRGIKGKKNSAGLAAPRESVVREFLER